MTGPVTVSYRGEETPQGTIDPEISSTPGRTRPTA